MPNLNRRQLLSTPLLLAGASALSAAEVKSKTEGAVAWYDVTSWGVEGKGWPDTTRHFDRFPTRAQAKLREPVWNLSRHSAGMLVRFETDSPSISVRYKLLNAGLALPHMPATGVSGVDLYARLGKEDRWLAVAFPRAQEVSADLAGAIDPQPGGRLYSAYLPLYNGVENLEIGVAASASFKPVAPRTEKPLVFYGTSIMQGACASRPGLAIPAILGRWFNRPTINLGFSGNGQMEAAVGALLAELDPAAYCIDCLPNMNAVGVAERTEPLVMQLRAARPQTPILLVEDRTFTNAPFLKATRERHAASRAALRAAYEKLRASGVKHLHYLEGEDQLGDDGEGATDGSHPNDLGMIRNAEAYRKALRRMLS